MEAQVLGYIITLVLHASQAFRCRHKLGCAITARPTNTMQAMRVTGGPVALIHRHWLSQTSQPDLLLCMRLQGTSHAQARTVFQLAFARQHACTQLQVTTSLKLSTGGGPVSCVHLSEGGFQVVYPLGL